MIILKQKIYFFRKDGSTFTTKDLMYDKTIGVSTWRDVVKDYKPTDFFDQGTLQRDGKHRTRDINHTATAAYVSQKNTPKSLVYKKTASLLPGESSGNPIKHEQLKEVENKLFKQRAKKVVDTVTEKHKKATTKGLGFLKKIFLRK